MLSYGPFTFINVNCSIYGDIDLRPYCPALPLLTQTFPGVSASDFFLLVFVQQLIHFSIAEVHEAALSVFHSGEHSGGGSMGGQATAAAHIITYRPACFQALSLQGKRELVDFGMRTGAFSCLGPVEL